MTSKLEERVASLERVTKAQRADLQGKIKADGTLLSAIGESQSKHGQQLEAIEGKIDLLGRGQKALKAGQETLQADMASVKGRLEKVEGKVDKLGQGLGILQTDMTTVKDRLDRMDDRFDKVDDRLARVDEKLDLLLSR
jgi:chromosome segregation ATPase